MKTTFYFGKDIELNNLQNLKKRKKQVMCRAFKEFICLTKKILRKSKSANVPVTEITFVSDKVLLSKKELEEFFHEPYLHEEYNRDTLQKEVKKILGDDYYFNLQDRKVITIKALH